MANEKARYSDVELEEFRAIIEEKLKVAKQTYHDCMAQLNHSDSNDVVDTSPTYKALEEGSEAQSKEEIIQMAQRQQKFIKGLEAALVRIQNLRKETGLEITDRINVTVAPNEETNAAIESFADYIKGQVLADSIEIGDNAGVETEFDDFKLNILVEKN